MPTYIVTAPDGSKHEETADTQEQALQAVQSRYQDPFVSTANEQSNVLAGIGGALKGMYLGGKQALNLADQSEIDAHNRAMAGLRTTPSGIVGEIFGNFMPAVLTAPIPGANTYTGAALTGAALNALQPLSAGDSRLAEAAKGAVFGAAGQGVGNVLGRVVKPVQVSQTPADASLVQKAQSMGIPLNAAQETGSKPLRWIGSALDNLPFTAEKQAALHQGQRDAWQRAILNRIGENADVASPEVMGRASQRIGQSFNDLSARNVVNIDPILDAEISRVAARNASGASPSAEVNKYIDWVRGLAQPQSSPVYGLMPPAPIDGRIYQNARSELTRKSKDAFRANNSDLGQSLKELRNALDDAAARSISAQDKEAWDLARKQWGTMKALEKAIDPVTGAISSKKLINELARANVKGVKYGAGNQELIDEARVGAKFIGDNLADSGTAQRSWYMTALQNPLSGGLFGGAAGLLTGGAPGMLLGAAAGAGTPLAVQKALWSPSGYLRQGLFDPAYAQNVARPAVTGMLSALNTEQP